MRDTYSAARLISNRDAPIVVETIEIITKAKGRLSTRELALELVSRSRSQKSPTHHLFEWNDRKAAQTHRLERAMDIIAAVYVTFEEQPDRPVRAFPVVTIQGKKGPYPMRKVLESRDLTEAMLEEAKREMTIFMQRYEGLVDLRDVFAKMQVVLGKKSKVA